MVLKDGCIFWELTSVSILWHPIIGSFTLNEIPFKQHIRLYIIETMYS